MAEERASSARRVVVSVSCIMAIVSLIENLYFELFKANECKRSAGDE
jgi:hypothetical protein